jgi:RNA polymerase sigma-70 factor (ECF subfamily)
MEGRDKANEVRRPVGPRGQSAAARVLGDPATWVDEHGDALFRYALLRVRDTATAEDVVQETFLAVFAARHTFNPNFAFRTWLWTILLNLCRRQLKRHQRQPRQVPHSQLSATGLASAEPVEWETGLSRLLHLERKEQLAALLNELPESQGDALRLRFFGGLKFSEIAEAMQSSISGAKRRVQTGLLALANPSLSSLPFISPNNNKIKCKSLGVTGPVGHSEDLLFNV